jgi:hypothetical protein
MRGFEDFCDSDGVAVADTPSQFQKAVLEAMQRPALQLKSSERRDRACVLWDSTLTDLTEALREFEISA